jgi:alpha-tubulin suppressor-like RCC1 family protein
MQFTAVATDSAANVLTGRVIAWTTSDTSTATVSPTGLVGGVRKGSVTITASSEGIQGSVQIAVACLFTNISAGAYYTCAVTSGSDGFCWGGGSQGQLGIGTTVAEALTPTQVVGGLKFATISTSLTNGSSKHTCALTVTGVAACWGKGNEGQLGDGAFVSSSSPVLVSGLPELERVAVGAAHSCALVKESGAAWCWGNNADGNLGNGDRVSSDVPVPVAGGLSFRSIDLGTTYTCGITTGGDLYCWGNLDLDHQFVPDTGSSLTPRLVSSTLELREVTAGWFHACAVDGAGAAYCWGDNHEGQLGSGDPLGGLTPAIVIGGLTFSSLAAGAEHTCGITTAGRAYCWGSDNGGQLGQPWNPTCGADDPSCVAPLEVPGLASMSAVSAGASHTCGITVGGEAYCWGANPVGELGDGTLVNRAAPMLVSSP